MDVNTLSNQDLIVALACGNPGALSVLVALDRSELMQLVRMKVSADMVWIGYKDHCHQSLTAFKLCLIGGDDNCNMVQTINDEMARDSAERRRARRALA